MRSIRRVAIAGATAATLILGVASAASADEAAADQKSTTQESNQGNELSAKVKSTVGSSKDKEDKDKDKDADKDGSDEHKDGELKEKANELSAKVKAGFGSSKDSDKKDKKEGEEETSAKHKEKEHSGLNSDLNHASSKLGDKFEADKPANGQRLWGSTKEVSQEPTWARYMKVVTIVSVIGSVLGLVVFPAYNFLITNHLI